MASPYTYLLSSLPVLEFSGKILFTCAEFIERNKQLLSEEDLTLINFIFNSNIYDYPGKQNVLLRFKEFEVGLRNELVKIRSVRKKIEVNKYFRGENIFDNSFYHIAIAAHHAKSPLEAEHVLDQARFNYLDELSFGHYFDKDALLIYCLKLSILERWLKINLANASNLLQESLKN
jgi:hypothetical protein